jgi:hypothetical protein
MTPAVAGRFAAATRLLRGDYLVVPSQRVDQQQVTLDRRLELVQELAVDDPIPWATLPGFYVGDTPVQRRQGPRVAVKIYRATADLTL